MTKSDFSKEYLRKELVKIFLGSITDLKEKLTALCFNNDVSEDEIIQETKNILENLKQYSQQENLTLKEKLLIEHRKTDILKELNKIYGRKRMRKYFGIGLVFAATLGLGIVVTQLLNSNSDSTNDNFISGYIDDVSDEE